MSFQIGAEKFKSAKVWVKLLKINSYQNRIKLLDLEPKKILTRRL